MRPRKPIGEILVDLKVLTPAQVEQVLDALDRRWDRQKFGQVACDMGLVREEHVLVALAVQMDLFPGINRLSLREILDFLSRPEPEPAPK